MRRAASVFVVGGVVLLAAIVATWRDPARRNAVLFTEMMYSPAARPQEPNAWIAGAAGPRAPVPGTRPRGFQPLPYGPTDADRARAALELTNPLPRTFAALATGRAAFEQACQHCHGHQGRGDGAVAQRFPAFAMTINTKATADLPDGELFHIATFGRNNMPPHGRILTTEQRWAVVHYLRDLQGAERRRLEAQGLTWEEQVDPRATTLVSADYGAELYAKHCSSCHGVEGREPLRGIPTLNHPRVLAVAASDFYLDLITHGRPGTRMPAWDRLLSPTQIRSIVAHIRAWKPISARPTIDTPGDPVLGRALYRGNCLACHGEHGKGGIGNSLNSPSFQALASDEFLRDTIALGRRHTAMPEGFGFDADAIRNLLAYLRTFHPRQAAWDDVRPLLARGNKRIGSQLFRSNCSGCHGRKAEGGIGSRLASPSFLALASDRFLYRAIVEGRPNTAMPAWRHLSAPDVADLITFIRSTVKDVPPAPPHRASHGRPEFGAVLYQQGCLPCHGPEGSGGVGGQIANRVFLDAASDDFLWQTIAYGKQGTSMRGFLKEGASGALMPMSAEDIDHVVAYLREVGSKPRIEPLRRLRTATSIAEGREIFENKAKCAGCHGLHGEGASGPSIGNPAFLRVASDGYLAGTIILGRENTPMLSFGSGGQVQLSQEEVEDVVAYLRSFETRPFTRHREVERTPSSLATGKRLFRRFCASCHGSDAKGPAGNADFDGYAPTLVNPEFLKAADDGFLLATIALGRPGTPMRPFARGAGGIADLEPDEIRHIVAFLRSHQPGKGGG